MHSDTTSLPRRPISLSPPGVVFAVIGLAALFVPIVTFKPNRIVPGDGVWITTAYDGVAGWLIVAILALLLLTGAVKSLSPTVRIVAALAGLLGTIVILGDVATSLIADSARGARVSPAAGLWCMLAAYLLAAVDVLNRLELSLRARWLVLAGTVVVVVLVFASGHLENVSVMMEYAGRQAGFKAAFRQHLVLAFGSLGIALVIGFPIGVLLFQVNGLRRPVLGALNLMQTVPSLALFGIMIPIFGWIAMNVPMAAELGVAGIGIFPALVALLLYSLLPVVSNTLVGLKGVAPEVGEAARGMGMTNAQVLARVQIPLALPVVLTAIRIVLVQNIGLAVIAGLIGGGGFGTFVFQGLNQSAMDLILLGTLPTIALALVAGTTLDLLVDALNTSPRKRSAS